MKEKINQKGFIQIPILIMAVISIMASVGTGAVLHKQEKLVSFVASVSEIFQKKDARKEKEVQPNEPQQIQLPIGKDVSSSQANQKEISQQKSKIVEQEKMELGKSEKLKKEAEEAKNKAEQELQQQSEAKRIIEEQQRQEESRRQDEARRLAEEQAKQEQNKQVLEKYLKKLVEAQEQFNKQLFQEVQSQIAKKEATLQQLNNLYAQIGQIDQQMTKIEQDINMLPYTVEENINTRISGKVVIEAMRQRMVANEIRAKTKLLQQEWWSLNSQRQPLVNEYNLLSGNPILEYKPQYSPQPSSVGDYSFYYDPAGKVSYIINPDYTKSYVSYYPDGKVNYISNPDGSRVNFYYSPNGQLDRISGF